MAAGRTFMTTCWSCESLVEAEYLDDEVAEHLPEGRGRTWSHPERGQAQAKCLDCGQFVPLGDRA